MVGGKELERVCGHGGVRRESGKKGRGVEVEAQEWGEGIREMCLCTYTKK